MRRNKSTVIVKSLKDTPDVIKYYVAVVVVIQLLRSKLFTFGGNISVIDNTFGRHDERSYIFIYLRTYTLYITIYIPKCECAYAHR